MNSTKWYQQHHNTCMQKHTQPLSKHLRGSPNVILMVALHDVSVHASFTALPFLKYVLRRPLHYQHQDCHPCLTKIGCSPPMLSYCNYEPQERMKGHL
jgi:hypothetical protein